MRVYAALTEMCDEALGLFVDRQIAELMVENWNRDEPDRAGRPSAWLLGRKPLERAGLPVQVEEGSPARTRSR